MLGVNCWVHADTPDSGGMSVSGTKVLPRSVEKKNESIDRCVLASTREPVH